MPSPREKPPMWRKVFDERTEKTRPDVPRAFDVPDLELEDDAETRVQRPSVRWPERRPLVRERSRASRTDGIGLSRPIVTPSRAAAPFWPGALILAALVAAALCLSPARLHRRLSFVFNAIRRPTPTATMSAAQPARAPVAVVATPLAASAPRPLADKKGVEISSLPPAAPAPPSRARPKTRPLARPRRAPTSPSAERAPIPQEPDSDGAAVN
jgi:hypothetical protein